MSYRDDEAECFAQTLKFFRSLDARDHQACVSAFAQGGVWHRQGRALATAQDMLESLDKRAVDRATSHLITNLISERLEEGRIAVRFLLTAFEGPRLDEGVPVAGAGGMMDGRDEYLRCADGWRLVEKRTRPLFKIELKP